MQAKKFYFHILQMRVHLLYGCTLFIIAALLGIWWYFFYMPGIKQVQHLEQATAQMYHHLVALKKSEHEYSALDQTLASLKNNLNGLDSKKSNQQMITNTLAFITDTANKNGMLVNSCRMCNQKDKSWCRVNEVAGDFRGTIDQTISFFEQLKTSKRLIDCTKCEIVHLDKDTCSMQAVFNIFYV